MWTIRYSPHRVEQTCTVYLGRCTWWTDVTWDGFHVAYCVWVTG